MSDTDITTLSLSKVKAPPAAAPSVETPKWKLGDKCYITAVHGPLVHMHTSEKFDHKPTKAVIDAFIALQLDAGKLAIESD